VNAWDKTWDMDLIQRLGLPAKLFGELSMPGTVVGELTPEIQAEVGFNAAVILPATHDTGSAFLSVPARDENAVYLSSGTWSLLGVENEAPITTVGSRLQNFTNEGGAWYRFRYLSRPSPGRASCPRCTLSTLRKTSASSATAVQATRTFPPKSPP